MQTCFLFLRSASSVNIYCTRMSICTLHVHMYAYRDLNTCSCQVTDCIIQMLMRVSICMNACSKRMNRDLNACSCQVTECIIHMLMRVSICMNACASYDVAYMTLIFIPFFQISKLLMRG